MEPLALIALLQTIVTTSAPGPTLDSVLFKFLVGFVTSVGSVVAWIAVRLALLVIPQIRKVNDFFVTWYGDPSDKDSKGIKHKIDVIANDVTELKGWSSSYNRALGALAKDNQHLRDAWEPGDPDRRATQREPHLG